MGPKITVIMPSYNVADYIGKCLKSVLNQTLSSLEILAIDAGSTDGTLEIVRDYAKKDKRITIIESEKKSYGYQVNVGIAQAEGEYVSVVETDDFVEPDMCEILYQVAKDTGADYVKGVGEGFFESFVGEDVQYAMKILPQKTYDDCKGMVWLVPAERPELVLQDYYVWNGLYRRAFIKNIRLNESPGAAYQDIGFMVQIHSSAVSAVYLDRLVYHYRRNNAKSSCNGRNSNVFRYLIQEYEYVDQLLRGKNGKWRSVCCYKMLKQTMGRIQTMAQSGVFWEEALPDINILIEKIRIAVNVEILNKKDMEERDWDQAMLLLENPRLLYEHFHEPICTKINAVKDIIEKISIHDVVIFGCGQLGQFLHILLASRKRQQIVAYCDNNLGKKNMAIQGLAVLKPEDAVIKYSNAIFIIASKYYADEMMKQLHLLGVDSSNIIVYKAGMDKLLLHIFMA